MRVAVIIAVLVVLGLLIAVPVHGDAGDKAVGKLSKKGDMVDVIIYKEPGARASKGAAPAASVQAIEPRIRVVSEYRSIGGMHAQVPAGAIERLREEGYIVEEDRLIPLALDSSNPVIFSDRAKRAGFDGAGVKVCVLDTGVDFYHTQVQIPPQERMADWLRAINGPYQPSVNGTTHDYTIYVNESLSTLNFSINWGVTGNRFDFYVYYPNGTYAGGTNESTPYLNVYWWLTVNLTDAPAGYYNITTNDTTIVSSSGEWFTLYWDPEYPLSGIFISDFGGHGTHVAGTIAGNNTTYEGVAPGATLYVGIICDGYTSVVHGCPTSSILNGMQWCVDSGADIISLSVGGTDNTGNCSDSMAVMADTAADSLLPVIATGNDGPGSGSVASPGCARRAVGVGAVNDGGTIASFSGRGPTGDWRIKPEVVAPGVGIISTYPINTFSSLQGTSMATPHVSGVAAIAKQVNPAWTPVVLKAALMATAVKSNGGPYLDNDYGAGLVDAMELINESHYDFEFSKNVSVLYRGEAFDAYSRWRSTIHGYALVNASNNTNKTVNISVPNNTQSLKVVLYWEENSTDNRSQMHLYLIEPNGTVVDNSTITNSTVQMVYNNSLVNGTWQVNVSGAEVYNNNTIVFYALKLYDNSFAYAEYNISSSLINFSATTDEQWANVSNSTGSDWTLGPHTIRFYSNNSFGNWSATGESSFVLWGWSELNESAVPTGVNEDTDFDIACRARDSNTTAPLESYNVTFWDNTSYLGSNETNATTGWANITINYSQPGTYEITCNITDDAGKFYNDSVSVQSSALTVSDTSAPQYSNLVNTSAEYGSDWQGNSTWMDNVNISHVLFESNHTASFDNYSAANASPEYYFTIGAGNLSGGKVIAWRWLANDTSGNWNATNQSTFIVSKAPTTVRLFLNGTESDKTYEPGSYANLTASINVTGRTVYMEVNITGWTTQSGTTRVENTTYFNETSYHNVTAWFPGDENYTESSVTYFVTVETTPSPPPSGGGGGGGAVAAPSTKTVSLNSKFAEQDTYQSTFSKNDKATYEFNGASHTITITEVTNTTVTLRIGSDPYDITLSVGETQNIDLDGDGTNDLAITLNSITGSLADLSFTKLEAPAAPAEEAPAEEPKEKPAENVTQPAEGGPERPEEQEKPTWEVVFAATVVAVAIISITKLRKSPKKRR